MIEAPPRLRLALVCAVSLTALAAAHAQPAAPLDSIRLLIREARYAQAETAARERLAAAEKTFGPESIEVADAAEVLVEALWRGGKVRAAETRPLAERAIAIREARLGPRHADVGRSLTSLAIVLRLLGDQAGARRTVDRALALQEEALGPDHLEVARSLTTSANLAVDAGDWAGAQAAQERALSIRRQRLPGGDAAIADNLHGLGLIRERQGDTAGAEPLYVQALAIRENALGPAHPDVALTLNNLGNIQSDRGNYAEARSLHQRALAIREKTLGPEHPDVAMSLNNLAVAVRDLGDHAAAWFLLERVFVIWEQVYGPGHQNVGIVCHNLGAVLVDLGDEAGTRLLVERARRVQRGGAAAAALSKRLTGVVGVAPPLGGSRGARALFELALEIKEKALGPNHASVGLTLTSLANAHRRLGEPDRAGALYERALAIQERAFGPKHPDAADTLDRLGESLVETGEYERARSTFERVLAILEEVQGPDHPHTGVIRQHLAEVLVATGDATGALRMALDAERIGRDHFRLVGRTLPEREALQYAAMRPVGLDTALSLLARPGAAPQPATTAVWDAVIRSRALVLDEMAARRRTIGQADDVAPLVTDLAAKREQLARLAVRGSEGAPAQYFEALARARDERDAAERALAERSLAFRREQRQQRLGLEDVRAALPPGSALVAFARYAQLPTAGRDQTGRSAVSRPSYLAFVMRAGADPAAVPLGPAAELEAGIARWRRQITAVAFAGGRSTTRAEAAARQAGAELRKTIWDPIATALAGASRVFIVPDGPLHLVSWEALPAGQAYLVEQGPLLHYLSAERDIVRENEEPGGRGLLVVDSPIFDDLPGLSARAANSARPPASGAPGATFRGSRSGCGGFQTMRFDPLPASAREAASLASIWRRQASAAPDRADTISPAGGSDADAAFVRLNGRAATEAAVKLRAAGTRVLHLATHGFFLGGLCAPAGPDASGARGHEAAASLEPGENPLVLSGFALTGANRRQAAGLDQEDGILTAEEIAALDLRGVEWAVLSACDTGVGETRAGEGVLGLRRAFQVAGARTVIMSLWPVEDEDTRRWMTGLYERRFARGLDTMEAVQQSTRDQLRRRRQAGLSTHPFHWAGFIAAGDWR